MHRSFFFLPACVLFIACSSSSSTPTTTDSGTTTDSSTAGDTGAGTDTGSAAETGSGTCGGSVASDPCFKQIYDAFKGQASCFNHPDTCKASGDPSGCGTLDMAGNCKWPDGSEEDTTFDSATSTATITVKGAGGTVCYTIKFMGSNGTMDIGGKTFTFTSSKSGTTTTTTATCPDGSKVTYTDADTKDCGNLGGGTCCTDATDPKCP